MSIYLPTSLTDTYTLQNGVKIPAIGYGTWQTPDGETTRDCVKMALDAGYRTPDIYKDGFKKVGCTEMGDILAANI